MCMRLKMRARAAHSNSTFFKLPVFDGIPTYPPLCLFHHAREDQYDMRSGRAIKKVVANLRDA